MKDMKKIIETIEKMISEIKKVMTVFTKEEKEITVYKIVDTKAGIKVGIKVGMAEEMREGMIEGMIEERIEAMIEEMAEEMIQGKVEGKIEEVIIGKKEELKIFLAETISKYIMKNMAKTNIRVNILKKGKSRYILDKGVDK